MQYSIRLLILTVIITALVAGCGGQPHRISGQAPLIDIDGLERQDDRLVITLAVRNLNDQTAEFSALGMRLNLDGEPLATADRDRPFDIPARSRELLRMDTTAEPSGLDRLDALGSGEHRALRWELTADLTDHRGRERNVDNSGWLHAVPGQPNRFR